MTTHLAPKGDSAVCPCCERSPFDLPLDDRMTLDPAAVTCSVEPDGWWSREPSDLRQGCLVLAAGTLLGWGAVALVVWGIVRWWSRG
jgi:hypothetical protein